MAAPLHLSLRFDRKAHLTMLAISVCVAYVAGGYAVAAAFQHSTQFLGDTFDASFRVAPDASGPGWTRVFAARAEVDGQPVTVVSLSGADAISLANSTAFFPEGGPYEDGKSGVLQGPGGEMSLVLVETISNPVWESGWLLVNPHVLRALAPRALDEPVFAYAPLGASPPTDAHQVPAVLPFFLLTGGEVARDVWLVLAFSAVIVAVVAGEFMRLEVVEKRREMGIWRSLGLTRRDVLRLLLTRVAAVAGVGTLFGWFLTLLVLGVLPQFSAGLAGVTAAVLLSLPVASVVVVTAAILGSIPVAWRAARAPVARLMEVRA